MGIKSDIAGIIVYDGEGAWVDGCKSIVEVRIARGHDILGVDQITQAVASIGTLVVAYRPSVGAAASDAAGTARLDLARTEPCLTRQCEALWIAIDTVQIGSLKLVSQIVPHLTSIQRRSVERLLTPHQPVAEQHRFIPHFSWPPLLYLPHMAVASQLDVHFDNGHLLAHSHCQ